jgi:hypothetical protein
MRIAYLDCFAGISGDMFLGALLSAGVPSEVLQRATAALSLHASLNIETVDRSGIASIKIHVHEDGHLAEAGPHHHHPHHNHAHGRSLPQIRHLIQTAPLQSEVQALAIQAFQLLGQSEAKVHNIPIEQVHFHEVGAVDAIVDIVAASAGIHHLQINSWYSSPVNVGAGTIECAHGRFPVPAPAAADLLRDCPTYSEGVAHELATPTGAALLRALNPTFGHQPPMLVKTIGYGAGTRNPDGFPNVLRISIGEAAHKSHRTDDLSWQSAAQAC